MARLGEVKKSPSKYISLAVSEVLYEELEFCADDKGMKVNDYIRQILSEAVIHHRQ